MEHYSYILVPKSLKTPEEIEVFHYIFGKML